MRSLLRRMVIAFLGLANLAILHRFSYGLAMAVMCVFCGVEVLYAQTKLQMQVVASGFKKPVAMAFAPGSSEELYVAEEAGMVYRVTRGKDGPSEKTAILDVAADELTDDAIRVLNILPHPKIATNREFLVVYRLSFETGCFLLVSKFTLPESAEYESEEQELLRVKQPCGGQAIGGGFALGEPGLLYVGIGVGRTGSGEGPAQNPNNMLGKILRVDIERDEPYAIPPDNPLASNARGKQEIFALGFQNPHRISYDPIGKRVFATDRGSGFFDEVNIVTAGGNYGWRIYEGSECQLMRFECMGQRFTNPMFQYEYNVQRKIVGGFVYRGKAYPAISGRYLLAEFPSGRLTAVELRGGRATGKRLRWGTNVQISHVTADSAGEPYILAYDKGDVRKVSLY